MIQKGGQQLKNDLEKQLYEDIGKKVTLEIIAQNLLEGDLKKIIVSQNNFARFKKTIIMMDECTGHKLRFYILKDLDQSLRTEYIHCIQYLDFEMKFQTVEQKVEIDNEKVFVTLLRRQRNSQSILDISDFLQAHVGRRKPISDIQTDEVLDESTHTVRLTYNLRRFDLFSFSRRFENSKKLVF